MDRNIDSRFDRIEKALAGLIDSVNKYHPSAIRARELEAADNDLSKGLEEVQNHQNNFLRIQELRKSSATLDTQIRDTLSSLASTRRDIVTTHTTTFPPGPNNPFAYEELLSYARRISKTTMPPASLVKATVAVTSPTSPEAGQTPQAAAEGSGSGHPMSITPSAAPTPSQSQSPAVNGSAPTPLVLPSTQQTITSLPEPMTQYLNPLSGQLFYPWPLEEKIRAGALASNQILSDQGIDPRGYDPAEEEERKRKEEEERKEREEKERLEQEEKEKKLREERERLRQQREREQEEWRRASMAAGSSPDGPSRTNTGAGEKKQFQFTSLDDDLDDDDD